MIFTEPLPKYIRSHDQLTRYQATTLRYLDKKVGTSTKSVTLTTSGTTTGQAKTYKYSLPEYSYLERYHFEKICYLNDLDPTLRVVWIDSKGYFNDEGRTSRCVFGPTTWPSLNNNVYTVPIPFNANKNEWKDTYSTIAKLHPGLVYTTPSSFLSSLSLGSKMPKLHCPVMFSGETLFDDIRDKALQTYTLVIDKMRCWDTGLSFIECKYGTKHIDDELCLAVQNDHNEIVSTDFFNYSTPCISHKTNDLGTIQVVACRCGIYGRSFSEFIGKSMQCLWDKKGLPCNPHTIVAIISSFIKSNNKVFIPYLIRQKKDGTLTLFIDPQNQSALTIKNVLTGLLHQPVEIAEYRDAPKINSNKLLFVASEFSPI